jgi:hypothetical protein
MGNMLVSEGAAALSKVANALKERLADATPFAKAA